MADITRPYKEYTRICEIAGIPRRTDWIDHYNEIMEGGIPLKGTESPDYRKGMMDANNEAISREKHYELLYDNLVATINELYPFTQARDIFEYAANRLKEKRDE